jgi:hypothetical protein
MTTATELVTAALGKILVSSADTPLEANELQDGIAQLNRMMAAWNLTLLAYVTVTSGSQVLSVPAYAEDAMVFGLAKRLADDYGVAMTQSFFDNVKQSKSDVLKQAIKFGRSPFPSTLPQGSGNNRYLNDRVFYPPSTAETTA